MLGPFEQLAGDVQPGLGLPGQFIMPGGEAVDPAFDRVFEILASFDRERSGPAVVVGLGDHRRLGPDGRPRPAGT